MVRNRNGYRCATALEIKGFSQVIVKERLRNSLEGIPTAATLFEALFFLSLFFVE